ncbi:hypothetical protein PsorP6_005955 [Peronosclerospora sorghi]|uniref:Uncharacterized protein n=1 Tax=Peronosclerospora sorghi TaxID=230839 RepID=A0ACC0W371_9STRA|nr:hypothetical protein PsorP6_005955 [Peronosclerospora sorghi]
MKRILTLAKMDAECIIMTIVYVKRLLTATRGRLELQRATWRRMVWDDLCMTNADFALVGTNVSLQDMNELELVYFHAVDYAVLVSSARPRTGRSRWHTFIEHLRPRV